MKVSSCRTFFKICLGLQLFAFIKFCIEMTLHNIFKSKNATKLNKSILEGSYKFLLDANLFMTLKWPMKFLWAVKFLATFLI